LVDLAPENRMQFPLLLQFKAIALASQIRITDGSGTMIGYVRQKMFKLKEAIEIFTDESRAQKWCEIRADRIIDFSAKYTFYDSTGNAFGAIRRKGMRSIWRAHYEILDHETPEYEIREVNGWVKVMDSLVGELPIIGLFSGYFFHPQYLATRIADGAEILRITKQPALLEGKFTVEALSEIEANDQVRLVLATLMLTLLERGRG